MLCAYCGQTIVFNRLTGGWLHAAPLGQLKVSRWEAQDVKADPPRAGETLNRPTLLHPAAVKRHSTFERRSKTLDAL